MDEMNSYYYELFWW